MKRAGILLAAFGAACVDAIAVGERVPSVDLDFGFPPEKVNLQERVAGKNVILVSLPGAFNPLDPTSRSVPPYIFSLPISICTSQSPLPYIPKYCRHSPRRNQVPGYIEKADDLKKQGFTPTLTSPRAHHYLGIRHLACTHHHRQESMR